jgi:type IV pilus assembly protein PilE
VLLIVVTVASVYDHQSSKAKKQAIHRLQEVAEWLHLQKASQGSFATILPPGWSASQPDMKYSISLATQPVTASDPNVAFPALGQGAFTLQAVPQDEDACGTLLLDHTGRRGVTGAGSTVADCWE